MAPGASNADYLKALGADTVIDYSAHCERRGMTGTPIRLTLEQIADWSQAGSFAINIDHTFEFGDVLRAWEYSQGRHTRGKCMIRIGE